MVRCSKWNKCDVTVCFHKTPHMPFTYIVDKGVKRDCTTSPCQVKSKKGKLICCEDVFILKMREVINGKNIR